MSGRREALVVAVHDYEDPGLSRLRAPGHDADALARVLGDDGVGGFHVRQLRNEPAHVVSEALEDFFADRDHDDLLLVYFSGHGLKDQDGTLHLAAANTKVNRLAATSVSASFINQQMTRSRSRRIVLILDCCYAGAFARGLTPRGTTLDLGLNEQLGGRGRAVITSSSAMEYSFEESRLAGDVPAAGPSVFTGVLVHGLETGAADLDGDGFVTLDEIYDYVYAGVREITPHQNPCKWIFEMQGSLRIARRGSGSAAAVKAVASTPARPDRRRWWWSAAGLAVGLLAIGIPALSHDSPPTTPSTAPPASSSPPAGPILFQDDFATKKGGWPDNGGAAAHGGYYFSDAYRFQSRRPGTIWGSGPQKAATVYPDAPSSIRVSTRARWSAPNDLAWFGVACRVRGDQDAYYLLVANGVAHIVKMKNEIPQFPELAVDALHGVDLSAGVRLDADCATVGDDHATRLTLLVDGRKVLDATDATAPLESGTVGVAVEMNPKATGGAEAEFQDFAVSRT